MDRDFNPWDFQDACSVDVYSIMEFMVIQCCPYTWMQMRFILVGDKWISCLCPILASITRCIAQFSIPYFVPPFFCHFNLCTLFSGCTLYVFDCTCIYYWMMHQFCDKPVCCLRLSVWVFLHLTAFCDWFNHAFYSGYALYAIFSNFFQKPRGASYSR